MSLRFGHAAVLSAVAFLSMVHAHAARQDGLVMYLDFDNEVNPLRNAVAKSTLPSATKTGDGLDMTLTNEGRFGKAARFTNGPSAPRVSDWAIDLGKLGTVYAGDFSIACWVKYASPHSGVILGNKAYGDGSMPGFSFAAASGNLASASASGRPLMASGGGQTANGKWHHWALVVNRKASTISYYIDGKVHDSRPLSGASATLDSGLSTIVGAGADGRNGARVDVDDIGVWSRALTDAELSSLGSAEGKRIPEPSSYALTAGAACAVAAWVARRRRTRLA